MDLLGEHPALQLGDKDWRILSRHENAPPQIIGEEGCVENASITEGCAIYGTVKNSVLGENVQVMPGATVVDSVLMGECIIGEGAVVEYAILDRDVEIGAGARVGKAKEEAKGITVIGEGTRVADGAVVADGVTLPE